LATAAAFHIPFLVKYSQIIAIIRRVQSELMTASLNKEQMKD
jgi:hypothetical protein